jgi:hypothetical protein
LWEESGKEAQAVRRKARKEWEGSLGWTGGGRMGKMREKTWMVGRRGCDVSDKQASRKSKEATRPVTST